MENALTRYRFPAHTAAASNLPEKGWEDTLKSVLESTVSIKYYFPFAFDTAPAKYSEATGFVVDAKKGYILTNRHVAGPGPFKGYCIFYNHEECDVYPLYLDPVHDFAILRLDPEKMMHMPITALELRPQNAEVGVEIRLVGNDSGEKLSILSGVISRLDRNAPNYGKGYSDFNTNYIQAAAAASGGSSGSPVVDRNGFAVAMQAGTRTNGASTDYFLPLHRPKRALELIRQDKDVTRGTFQIQWEMTPFEECRRLGLSPEFEKQIHAKFPEETGMLVAKVVIPQSPASSKVKHGDLLLCVNGELITQFVRLDAVLDDSVGQSISLTIQRAGENMDFELQVGDLHAITPSKFASVAGGSFHNLSYHLARRYRLPLNNAGVFVCKEAGSFVFDDDCTSGRLIQKVDKERTPDLDTFIEVMKRIPNRNQVVIHYKNLGSSSSTRTAVHTINRNWHRDMWQATQNNTTGLWDFQALAGTISHVSLSPSRATPVKSSFGYTEAAKIVDNLVRVRVSMPMKIDSFPDLNTYGAGLVVDAVKGLVLVSRAFLPHRMCDISLTIARSIVVDATVVFMHPLHNYAIIQYDASLVEAPMETPRLAEGYIKKGVETNFCGIKGDYETIILKTAVINTTPLAMPESNLSHYRAINCDDISFNSTDAFWCRSGVLIANDGTIQAVWLPCPGKRTSFSDTEGQHFLCLATPSLLPILEKLRSNKNTELRILNIEFQTIEIWEARARNVSEERIKEIQKDLERQQLLMVRKVDPGHTGGLQEADILLTLGGKLVTRFSDLDVLYDNESLNAVIIREGEEKAIDISTVPVEKLETRRVVKSFGAVLQSPHQTVRRQMNDDIHSKVYISSYVDGSPANMYKVSACLYLLLSSCPRLMTALCNSARMR